MRPHQSEAGNAISEQTLSKSDPGRPLVSILIPAFNAEEWIADTLRSALGQTWEPKEIIVVDDGSIDKTLAIARQFESDRVRVVAQKNQGAAAARNTAFSLSKGDYIQWLDADDLLAPDKIARQMEARATCPSKRVLLSGAFGCFIYRQYNAKFVPTGLWADLSPLDWLTCKLEHNTYMQTATWLVSRELSVAAGPWDTRLLADDDGEYFSRVLLKSEGVRFLPEAKVYYRAPLVGSLSSLLASRRKLEAHWISIKLHVTYLRSLEDSARTRSACLQYLQRCLIFFYPEMNEIVQEAQQWAHQLGGHLVRPNLSWKYSSAVRFLGWNAAKTLKVYMQRVRWQTMRRWDKVAARARMVRGYPDDKGIHSRGRYGDWGDMGTDEGFISGENAAERATARYSADDRSVPTDLRKAPAAPGTESESAQ